MNSYTKPNVILPFSLHDAQVTSIIVKPSVSIADGSITFKFADGIIKVDEEKAFRTNKASVTISGIDFDFSGVYYCKNNIRREVSFSQLAEDVEKHVLEVIDETYGYNQTKFSCNMILEDDWYDAEIEIYHFNETVYRWED